MKTTSRWVLLAVAALAAAAPRGSDAKPQATCKGMCQRLTDCKLSSYTKTCLDSCKQYGYEASEEGRAQLLVLTQYTCKQIQSAVGATDEPRSSSPSPSPPPSPSNPYDDDPGGNAASDGSCSWVCRRLTECKLTSAQRCGEMCSIAASNGQPLRIGRESCPEIKKAFVSSKWTCWAEGSSGYAYGTGSWTYGNTSVPASGRTRNEAYLAASEGCNAMMSAGTNTSWASGAKVDSGDCKVTRCDPPGSPLF